MRKLSKNIYIMAFVITAGIFLLGLFLGLIIEEERSSYVEEQYQEQSIVFSSSQLQYEFLSMLDEKDSCPAVYETLYSNLEDLEGTRIRLEKFDRKSTLEKNQFELLQREYLLAEIRYWMLAKKTKELCNYDVVTILNFYSSEEECPYCDQQSFVLTYLKELFGDRLLIFSFNSELEDDEPMLGILDAAYNITSYPTLVIGDEVYSGLKDSEELLGLVCANYLEAPGCCDGYC